MICRFHLSITTITLMVVTQPALAQALTENFSTATPAAGGWTLASGFWPAQNNSTNPQPFGPTGGAWGPGVSLLNPPPSPPNGSYFATDTTATGTDGATVSDWLFTPILSLRNGSTLTFSTRTPTNPSGQSHLEIRIPPAGESGTPNVGTTTASVGNYSRTLLDVNALDVNLNPTGNYPESWTQFTATISGVTGTVQGRVAFRTLYANGGLGGANGDTVGIDSVTYTLAAVPEPGGLAMAACAAVGLALRVRVRPRGVS